MHAHRTAGSAGSSAPSSVTPPWSHCVRGLGVCDALQLRLEPGQLPWLLEELEERRIAHEQSLEDATAARTAAEGAEIRARAREDVERHRHELALLAAIHERIQHEPGGEAVLVTGPAPLVSGIVRNAAQTVTEALAGLAEDRAAPQETRDGERLLELADAARAWVHTLVALARLEWFTFEPDERDVQA
jgi:hypothetical protein